MTKRSRLRQLSCLFMTLLLVATLIPVIGVRKAVSDEERGKLTLLIADEQHGKLQGGGMALYLVGSWTGSGYDLNAGPFDSNGAARDLPTMSRRELEEANADIAMALALEEDTREYEPIEATSVVDGVATFEGLTRGIYLVVMTHCSDDERIVDPFLVTIPDASGSMDVTAEPKPGAYPSDEPEPDHYYPPHTPEDSEPGTVRVWASKKMHGRKLAEGEFTFELYEKGGTEPVQVTTNGVGSDYWGKVTFPQSLVFTTEGTFEYEIRERVPAPGEEGYDPHITYDGHVANLTVETFFDENEELAVDVTYDAASPNTFNNTYTRASATAAISAQKLLEGRDLTDGEFEFELIDAEGVVVESRENEADGTVAFDPLTFDEEGTYVYSIVERTGDDATVTYDQHIAYATVQVAADTSTGDLQAQVTYDEQSPASFVNRYEPTKTRINVPLSANKTLEGRLLKADEFSFELVDGDGNVLQVKRNDEYGHVSFDDLIFEEEGSYEYEVREVEGDDPYVEYDTHVAPVSIEVERDVEGKLVADVSYDSSFLPSFENITKKGTAIFEARKALAGRKINPGEFDFQLIDSAGEIIQTKSNDEDGGVVFDPVMFDEEGEYQFRIREVWGGVEYIEYDGHVIVATVTVTRDPDTGNFDTDIIYQEEGINVKFQNIYSDVYYDTQAYFDANKTLVGRPLEDDEFTFELRDADTHEVLQTMTNDAHGFVEFDEEVFTEVGVYRFEIVEVPGADRDITYDRHVAKATVTVTMRPNGELIADVEYEGSTFTNVYTPPTPPSTPVTAKLAATKEIDGRKLKAGEFSFELRDDQGTLRQTKTNAADGSITFDDITFTKEGTYTFTIAEAKGTNKDIDYDDHVARVGVVVTRNEEGTLEAEVNYDPKSPARFVNTYIPAGPLTTAELMATKTLKGRTLKEGEFTFELRQDGKTVQKAKNRADGMVKFDKITYTKAGTYAYTIVETKGTDASVSYDSHEAKAKVTVTAKDDGTLASEVTYDDDAPNSFTNTVATAGGEGASIALRATKELKGRELKKDEFSFELKDATGKVIQTKKNGEDGIVSFDAIDFEREGTYVYTISEVEGKDDTVSYDDHEARVTVRVTTGEGAKLVAKATYDEDRPATFINTVPSTSAAAILKATKTLTGRKLKEGEFSFVLRGEDGKAVQKATNDADGVVTFKELKFTKAGSYAYTIEEVKGSIANVTYDSHVAKATVVVSEGADGTLGAEVTYDKSAMNSFSNTYKTAGTTTTDDGDDGTTSAGRTRTTVSTDDGDDGTTSAGRTRTTVSADDGETGTSATGRTSVPSTSSNSAANPSDAGTRNAQQFNDRVPATGDTSLTAIPFVVGALVVVVAGGMRMSLRRRS